MLLRRVLSGTAAATRRAQAARVHASTSSSVVARSLSSLVYTSPHPDLPIPNETIWGLLTDKVDEYADRNAFICGLSHDTVTYRELYDSSQRLAVELARDGVQKGDVVVLHAMNCMEYPMVVLALTSLGAITSTSSPMFSAQELAQQIQVANAKFVIAHRGLESVAIEAGELSGMSKENMYTVGSSPEPRRLKCINEASRRDFESFKFERIDPHTNVLLPFSSGTTGLPKGVMLSARNMIANVVQVRQMEDFGDHMLSVLPLFHIYALMLMHTSMFQGSASVVLPRFEPESLLTALSRYKIEKANIAPPIAIFLAHHPLVDEYDLTATKYLVSGGAPMGVEVERLVSKRLNVQVKQAYGMTEASPAVNYTEDNFRKPGSVGRIVPNTELRVKCTATDKDLPPNTNGELLYRGPQVMLGYLNNDEATAKVMTSDGFLRTGDVGYIDDDGFVHVVDRVKELIKYKGHQVAPAELEDILNHHPDIADSCCVRGYDEYGEELPKAYVVLAKTATATEVTADAVMQFVADKVAPFKKVRAVEFIDAIPKSVSGKILRRQLQDLENQRR